MKRISVEIHADDPVVRAGMVAILRQRPELQLLDKEDQQAAAVRVLCTDSVDDLALAVIRGHGPAGPVRTVLVVGEIHEAQLLAAIECGALAVVRRREATPEALVHAIEAAERGAGDLPGDLLGELLHQLGRARRFGAGPDDLAVPGISDRESAVIRLVAEGFDTREIADKLSYSERTIKSVLHGLMLRQHLRNRAHAVAYAARQGYLS